MPKLLALIFLALLSLAARPADSILVGDFSSPTDDSGLPPHWQPLTFADIDRTTSYNQVMLTGHRVIEARTEGGASGLMRKITIDPQNFPLIRWQWQIQAVVAKGDLHKKAGDDYAARLYITFAYDPAQVSLWEKIKFNTIKLFYGEYPPIAAINYIWANKATINQISANPYTARVKMIVVESGNDRAGQWLQEERNIRQDYEQAFGGPAPPISGVAIMTDGDNTHSSATAWYGNIVMGP